MLISILLPCAFIAIDVVTGLLKALHNKNLNSSVIRTGLYHKISEVLTVLLTAFIECVMPYLELNIDLPLLPFVSTYIVVMELISIIENLSEMNDKIKRLFEPYLEKLKRNDKHEQ